jgi:type I restriction enzyme S subunit
MGREWPLMTIADCASPEPYATQIGPFGEKLRAHSYVPMGVPVLRGTNVNPDGRFHDDDFVFIDSEWAATEFDKFECEAGDVILCHKGTLGKIGIIPKTSRFPKYVMGNSMLKVRCDRTKLEPLYLYYWLCSADGQNYLFSRVSQVGVPQIQRPLSTLREAVLPVPPLPEQRAIAHILGTLDDKIELNRRMNETLEGMARALFRSWFVDFDPVRAKAEGRQPPGMDPATAALFPSEFHDSELGPIPKGWQPGSLGDVTSQIREGVMPHEVPSDTPYIGLEHMPQRSIALSSWGSAADAQSQKGRFRQGQILFGKLRPYFHKVGVAPVDGLCSTDIVVLEAQNEAFFSFCLGLISSDAFVAYTNAGSDGTRMPRTSWKQMAAYMCVLPPENIAHAFDALCRPLVRRIRANIFESRTLTDVRDTLLPRLLSGELSVSKAMKSVEATA